MHADLARWEYPSVLQPWPPKVEEQCYRKASCGEVVDDLCQVVVRQEVRLGFELDDDRFVDKQIEIVG